MSKVHSNVFHLLPGFAFLLDKCNVICDCNANFQARLKMNKQVLLSTRMEDLFPRPSEKALCARVLDEMNKVVSFHEFIDAMEVAIGGVNMLVKFSITKLPEDGMLLVVGTEVPQVSNVSLNIACPSPRPMSATATAAATARPSTATNNTATSTPVTSSPYASSEVENIVNRALAKERIQKLALVSAEKDRFIRLMFHAIRTPLHNLSNSFNASVKQFKMPSGVADELTYQIDACTGLVEDLSFATMFESDQVLHPKPVRMNLRKELESILSHLDIYHELELSKRPMEIVKEIDFGIPEVISVDQSILRALYNLLQNAVKYCCPNGTMEVGMTYCPVTPQPGADAGAAGGAVPLHKKGRLSVTVKNSVAEALDLVQVNKSFQSCYNHAALFVEKLTEEVGSQKSRSNSQSGSDASRPNSIVDSLTSSEGLGLGLYVAYNIISNLGGLLEVTGDDTEACFKFSVEVMETRVSREALRLHRGDGSFGSEVSLLLRSSSLSKEWRPAIDSGEGKRHIDTLGLSPSKKSGASLFDFSPRAKPRVLIVDDSPICRKVLVKALESNGYDTATACDGKEACDRLEESPCPYEAVLMDLRMPIMDGITATRVCKARPHLAEVPIIIVTAELGEDVRRECMEAKASHFVSKPAKVEELLRLLSSCGK